MKKLIFILFAGVIIVTGCNPNHSIKNDLKKLNIQGEVEKIVENSYMLDLVDGELQKGEAIYFKYINHFDKNGNKSEDLKYTLEGTLSSKYTYTYNQDGQRISEKMFYNTDELIREIRFEYKDELLVSDQSFDANGNAEKTYRYHYDTNKQLTKQEIYSKDKLHKYFTFKYNEDGKRSEEHKFSSDDALIESYQFKYNEHGDVSNETVFDDKGNSIEAYRYEYVYDDHDNWIEKMVILKERPLLVLERTIHYKK